MRTLRLFSTATAVLLTIATSIGAQGRASRPADEQARLRAAVEASGMRMAESFNAGDIAGFIRAYSDDVWVFPPNAPAFQGRAAALDFYQRTYNAGLRTFQVTTTGLDRQGNMAYETGTYTVDAPAVGQSTSARDNGKYVHVWKRGPNGDWRTHFVMWSSDNPPPPPAR